jgi:fatty acid desaturase
MLMMPAIDPSWDDAYRGLVPLMRPDNRTNIGYIAREYAFLAAVLYGCHSLVVALASGSLAQAQFVPLAILGMVLVAVGQHRLSGLAHDASHHVLFKNRLANELVADLFLMFPIVAITQTYRAAHLGHHRFVNDPARDPDLMRLNAHEPQNFPMTKTAFWHKYVALGLWPPTMLRYLLGRAKAANLGVDGLKTHRGAYSKRVARSMRGAYWLSLLAVVHLTGSWTIFWLFWVVPLLTAYPILMQLREIAHHSNAPDDGDLTNSRVFRINPLLSAAVFPYGQAFHLTHHLFARVPHYRIARAHEILCGHAPYRESVVVCRGYFFRTLGTDGPSVLDVLARPRADADGTALAR